ncbi:hypothetical protein PFISCL1PPCAC_10661, partial [Pristionchus fissidentatus]
MNTLLLSLLFVSSVSAAVVNPLRLVKVPTCTEEVSDGLCSNKDNSCKSSGYMCDTTTNFCCPMVDYSDEKNIAGPALSGKCQDGYVAVPIVGSDSSPECVNLATVPKDVQCPVERQAAPVEYCSPSMTTCAAGYSCYSVAGVCCKD